METAAIVAAAIGLLGALAIPLRRMLMSVSPAAAAKSDESGDRADGNGQSKPDTSYIDSTRKSIESIRADLGSYGTAIAVASSGLIAAATLTALDDLFPVPRNGWTWLEVPGNEWIWLVSVLALISVAASAVLTALFFRARRRVLLDTEFLYSAPKKDPRRPSHETLKKVVKRGLNKIRQELTPRSATVPVLFLAVNL